MDPRIREETKGVVWNIWGLGVKDGRGREREGRDLREKRDGHFMGLCFVGFF